MGGGVGVRQASLASLRGYFVVALLGAAAPAATGGGPLPT